MLSKLLATPLSRWLTVAVGVVLMGVFVAGVAVIYVVNVYGRDLPDIHQLANYAPPVLTRIYAGDGKILQEYAVEGRLFVPLTDIPKRVSQAFISAEDQNFYENPGIDISGIFRVLVTNAEDRLSGNKRRMKGASTITQQVAQVFLLGKEYSISRKIREAILSIRIDQAYTKDHILELYLNEIYLGHGSYGVAAAALNYFNKPLDQLTISEAAFLAGLPKGPVNYDLERHPDAARERRDYVIGRMEEDGYITDAEAEAARKEPLVQRKRDDTEIVTGGDYYAEEVRRELAERYGDDMLYKGGLAVRTSLDPFLQETADRVLREGLIRYDRRHGWRGPVTHLDHGTLADVQKMAPPAGMPGEWQLALVDEVGAEGATILLRDGKRGTIPLSELTWARQWLPEQLRGPMVTKASQVLKAGDVVMVSKERRPDPNNPEATLSSPEPLPEGVYGLRQIPAVEGAVVVMDPHTGRVLALSGGFSYATSQFDRATQAARQPGSAFKPFVYLTAMENGYTPSTLVLDAPIVLDLGPGQPQWRPKNYEGEYLGLATLRRGLEKSRNLMTVRVAQAIGMDKIAANAQSFGIVDNMPLVPSAALGAVETTPLRLVTAYAELVNGGRKLTPTLIDRVQDRNGKTIYRYDDRACPDCSGVQWTDQQAPPVLPDTRPQLSDPASIYQIVHMMEGVIERGTGHSIAVVGKPLAGKTGTTNDSDETWFIGFSPDLVAGVYVGFDERGTLGPKEEGATCAAPIFRDFMLTALKDKPATPFRVPDGISFVRVDHETGKPAQPGESGRNIILEAFKTGTSPFDQATILGQGESAQTDPGNEQAPAGGLY